MLNDVNSDLVNLYRVVQHHLDEFVRQFRRALSSRELFGWLKATAPATQQALDDSSTSQIHDRRSAEAADKSYNQTTL